LRAAQSWAIDNDELDLALAVIVPLCIDSTLIGQTALEWASALAVNTDVDGRPLGPALLAKAAVHAALSMDPDRATALDARRSAAQAGLGLEPEPGDFQAPALIAMLSGSPDAVDGAHRWVEVTRAAGDRYETVHALTLLATSISSTDPAAAAAALQEALAEARRLANPSTLSWALTLVGIHETQLDSLESVAVLEEAIRVGTSVGNRQAVAMAYARLAGIYDELGDQSAALRAYLTALDLEAAAGNRQIIVGVFVRIASRLADSGDDEGAALLQGAADAMYLHAEIPPVQMLVQTRAQTLAALAERLGGDRLTELLARGAAMADDEAVVYARTKLEAVEASRPQDD
jgi:tetratricopeptide (TPR) repeat protein